VKNSNLFAISLCVLGLFVVTTASAANASSDDVVITAKAREHFRAGVAYVDDPSGPKYEEAYREFHLALDESPTYRIHTNIGLCALNLERDGEAIASYELFLSKAKPEDIPKEKRTLMERDISMLKASLVRITVKAMPSNVDLSDERHPSKGTSITNRYELKGGSLSLGIHPGHHRITATAEGFEPQTWEIEANSASTHTHDFTLKPLAQTAQPTAKSDVKPDVKPSMAVTAPPENNQKKTPTLVYVGVVATGVFAIGATATGLIANSKKSDYNSTNATGNDPTKARDLRDSFKSYALLTDIGLGAAILSAGATAIIYFTAPSSKPEAKFTASRWRIDPNVGPTQAGLSFSGNF